jgi:hypothetical protein
LPSLHRTDDRATSSIRAEKNEVACGLIKIINFHYCLNEARFTANETRFCHDFFEADSEPVRRLAKLAQVAHIPATQNELSVAKIPWATEPGNRRDSQPGQKPASPKH